MCIAYIQCYQIIHTYIRTGGFDYGPFPTDAVNISHTVKAGKSESVFGIPIKDDTTMEPTETFFVELFMSISSYHPVTIGSPSRAEVFIEDNDSRSYNITMCQLL